MEIERISLEFTEDSFKKDFLDKNNLKYKDVKFHYDESKGNAFDGVCTMTLPMESARKLILLNGTVH